MKETRLEFLQSFPQRSQKLQYLSIFFLLLTKIYNTLHNFHYSHCLQHSTILRFRSLLHTQKEKRKKKEPGQNFESWAESGRVIIKRKRRQGLNTSKQGMLKFTLQPGRQSGMV